MGGTAIPPQPRGEGKPGCVADIHTGPQPVSPHHRSLPLPHHPLTVTSCPLISFPQRLAPVLAIIGAAIVAVVLVIVTHASATTTVLLPANERVINGKKYVAIALPAGAAPPQGAILAQAPKYSVRSTALPVASAVAVNNGRYGTLAEKMVTEQHGADAVPTGNFLKGSSPSVATLARAATYTKDQQKALAKDFSDAVNDCGRDGNDNCDHFLHPGGESLRQFEENQDRVCTAHSPPDQPRST